MCSSPRGSGPTIHPVGLGRFRVVDAPKEIGDRQLDALLERLDRLTAEVHGLNRRLDSGDNLAPVVRELALLNESLQTLAYAALGQSGPQVQRRRRAG